MTPQEADNWRFGATLDAMDRVVAWGSVAQYCWMAEGVNNAQLRAAIGAACELEIIADIWPRTIDSVVRPTRTVAAWREWKWKARNLWARVICAFLSERTK